MGTKHKDSRVAIAALLFAATIISIPATASMDGAYCVMIPVGLMMASFGCLESQNNEGK